MENQKQNNPTIQQGWTLRDEFAKAAMQGHLASEYYIIGSNQEGKESLAKEFYEFADAMLKQRELNNQ